MADESSCPSTFLGAECDLPVGHRGVHTHNVHHNGQTHTTQWGPRAADAVPLSQRMLDAADILEEFNREYCDIYTTDAAWRPSELRREALHQKRFEESTQSAGQMEMWGDN